MTIAKKTLRILLASPNYTANRNDFLREYLYTFRNRLSELQLKRVIEYRHFVQDGNDFYTLLTPEKAMDFVNDVDPDPVKPLVQTSIFSICK